MKFPLLIITFFVCTALTGCSDYRDGQYVEVDQEKQEMTSKKPSLEANVTVNGDTALVSVKTSMKISGKMFGKERKAGEGHIHMYLDDGEKQPITFSPVKLEDLSKGEHQLKLSLHNNDHTPYDVTKTITFTVN
jgi:hypothetical protein